MFGLLLVSKSVPPSYPSVVWTHSPRLHCSKLTSRVFCKTIPLVIVKVDWVRAKFGASPIPFLAPSSSSITLFRTTVSLVKRCFVCWLRCLPHELSTIRYNYVPQVDVGAPRLVLSSRIPHFLNQFHFKIVTKGETGFWNMNNLTPRDLAWASPIVSLSLPLPPSR